MHVLYAWLSCRPSDAVPCTWGMPQKHPRGQLWQRRHGLYALANNNKPHKNYVISSDLFSRTQKSFFGVFIRLKIEDEKLRQTALGCYLIWSRELFKCLFAISCRLALRLSISTNNRSSITIKTIPPFHCLGLPSWRSVSHLCALWSSPRLKIHTFLHLEFSSSWHPSSFLPFRDSLRLTIYIFFMFLDL